MSLINLLTVGNSFSTVLDRPHRYKQCRDNLLPRFGTTDPALDYQPVSVDEEARRESCGSGVVTALQAQIMAPSLSEPPEKSAEPTNGDGEARGNRPAESDLAKPMETRPAYPQGRWSFRSAFPFFQSEETKRAVQRELPWDDIAVARNDLNDEDVEVVRAVPPEESAATAGFRSESAETGRMNGRTYDRRHQLSPA